MSDKKYFFSISTKSVEKENGDRAVKISSQSYDRDKDRMTEKFLTEMVEQINTGHVALYTDHGVGEHGYYSVFDKMGFWKDADIIDGDLYAVPVFSDADIVSENVTALKNMIESNTPLAWSIGFAPGDSEENEKGGLDFENGDLMEVSAVGIPANPDAVSSFKSHYKNFFRKYFKREDKMPEDEEEEEEKQIESLEDALGWIEENAPDEVISLIADALKEDEEEDTEEEAADEDEEEDKAGDEDEEEEEKGITLEQVKSMIDEAITDLKEKSKPKPDKKLPGEPKGKGAGEQKKPEPKGALKDFKYD